MKRKFKGVFYLMAIASVMLVSSCSDDDAQPVPTTLNFTNADLGLDESVEVGITFSRSADAAGSLVIQVLSTGLTYGESADYYTDPVVVNDELVLPYDAGDESVSFTLYAGSALNIANDETITFTLTDSDGFDLGQGLSAVVTVAENFVATEGTMEINGGGPEFPNQVFMDLSKLTQTAVNKYTWDLGFSSTAGSHHVILNSSAQVMARPMDGADIDAITAADTAGFAAKMYLSNYVDTEASGWIDNQSGDLSQTAFGTISSTDSENMVFIIKRDGEGRNWKKVRVIQDGDNYKIQYADIAATTHTEITITKDAAYNFKHFDLDNGEVSVAPQKEAWDMMYGTYSGVANFGVFLAIGYNDYVVLNRSGVSAAMVEEATISYDNFSASDIDGLTMVNDNISVIGSSWRSLENFSLVLNEAVYYIISDAEGNNYKLKFTRLESLTGERGSPEFKIELL